MLHILSCRDANYPTVWVSLFAEGCFATGCAFLRETTRSERERELRGPLQLIGNQNRIAIDGAGVDGSAGGHWRSILHAPGTCFARKMQQNTIQRQPNASSQLSSRQPTDDIT